MNKAGFGVLVLALQLGVAGMQAQACPIAAPQASDTQLVVQLPAAAPRLFGLAELRALPSQDTTVRRTVEAGGGLQAQAPLVYTGVPLRQLLTAAGLDEARNRAARLWVFELVASDNYRALFSWGELFNHDSGDAVLVIHTQNGKPLDAAAGPLAVRALGDQRPGPRHVRNLCAIRALMPGN